MKTDYNSLIHLIETAQNYRNTNFERRAERNKRWYGGDYTDGSTNSNQHPLYDDEYLKYSVNLTRQVVNVIQTSIFSKLPEFSFFLKGNMSQAVQKQIQEAIGQVVPGTGIQLNKLSKCLELGIKIILKEMKLRPTIKRIVRDASLFGFGIGKLGYKYKIDKKTESHITTDKEKLEQIGLSASDIDVSDYLKNEKPYFIHIDPRTILLPPEFPDSLPWLVQEIYVDKDDAEKKYKVKGLKVVSVGSVNNYSKNKKQLVDKVKIYEMHIFDEEDPKVVVMADGYNGIIKETAQPLTNEDDGNVKNLFKILYFNDPIDEPYPLSDVDIVASQIMEANVQIARRVENMRKFTNQYLITGSPGSDVINDIKKGQDGDMHHVVDKDAKIQQIPRLSMGTEFYNNINSIRSEMFEVLGLTDYAVGGSTQKRKATEAYFVEAGQKARVNDRMLEIDDFFFGLIDTLVELLKTYQASDRVFRLQYEDTEIAFTLNSKLLGLTDSDVIVVPGSTVELDRNFQLKKTEATIKVAQAFAEVTDQRELAKQAYTDLGWAVPERFILQPKKEPVPVPRPGVDGITPKVTGEPPVPGEVDLTQDQRGGVSR